MNSDRQERHSVRETKKLATQERETEHNTTDQNRVYFVTLHETFIFFNLFTYRLC